MSWSRLSTLTSSLNDVLLAFAFSWLGMNDQCVRSMQCDILVGSVV